MRTVWTMGFVAAAALSFCFPDFIVFRLTQAVIWAIALLSGANLYFFTSLLLQYRFNDPITFIAIIMCIPEAAALVGCFVSGWAASRYGAPRTAAVCILLAGHTEDLFLGIAVAYFAMNLYVLAVGLRDKVLDLLPGAGDLLLEGAIVLGEDVGDALYAELLRDVPAGTPLRKTDLRPLVLVKRGQLVQLTVGKSTGFVVTAHVEALQDGRIGEQVKAKNPDSGRVLTGVVKGPNTLEGL